MKLNEKVTKIALEVEEIRAIYRNSQVFSALTNINAIGWLIVGLTFLITGYGIMVLPCFAIALLNMFTILYNRSKKNAE